MLCAERDDGRNLNVYLNRNLLELDQFKYLGAQIGMRGGWEEDVSWRIGEARKATGRLQ